MANLPARGLAALALGVSWAAVAACTSFSGTTDDSPDGAAADATTNVESGADASTDAAVDAGADADGSVPSPSCDGGTFCETFDTGDLTAIAQRWGLLEVSAGCTGCIPSIVEEATPARRFLQARTSTTPDTYARLTHPLGATTTATHLTLAFDVRFLMTGSYEIVAVNLFNGSNQLSGDLVVRTTSKGTLTVAWSTGGSYTTSGETAVVADGAWHTITLDATPTGATLLVGGVMTSVGGSPFAMTSWPMARLSAGVYYSGGAAPLVAIDDVRLYLSP